MERPRNDVAPAEAEARQWCRDYLAGVAKLPAASISPEAEFNSLGLDSAELLFMVAAVEKRFGLDLASDTTVEYPSTATLARFIAAELAAQGRGG